MKFLILGAGPSGLSFANMLQQEGCTDFLVLEAEREAGGLCRSQDVDGAPLDIGGGHFLDVRSKTVCEFLFQFMPENEWNHFERDSRISIHGQTIHHPFEANIWQLDMDAQVEYLKSIATAGCNIGEHMPKEFVKWIYWKLGSKIAEDYMLPYNQKMFGENLNQLGTYWLEKLPNVSFEDTLRSCLKHQFFGKQPGHAKFYYPKQYGYGELWLRMARNLGDKIQYQKKVTSIDFDTRTAVTQDLAHYQADILISTIPWTSIQNLEAMPDALQKDVTKLKHSAIQVAYQPDNLDTSAHWIYYPDPNLSYHRILLRHNFCTGSKGVWTETNADRVDGTKSKTNFCHMNHYAYPLNTIEKPQIMERLLSWAKDRHVYGLGRWGEHQHYNSDVSVERAISLAKTLATK